MQEAIMGFSNTARAIAGHSLYVYDIPQTP